MGGRLGAGLSAILHHIVGEAQAALGGAEAREVVIDQDRHRLAEEARGLALRHEEPVAEEIGMGHRHLVRHQILVPDDPVGLQRGRQAGEVEPGEGAVGAGRGDQEGMGLASGQPARSRDR